MQREPHVRVLGHPKHTHMSTTSIFTRPLTPHMDPYAGSHHCYHPHHSHACAHFHDCLQHTLGGLGPLVWRSAGTQSSGCSPAHSATVRRSLWKGSGPPRTSTLNVAPRPPGLSEVGIASTLPGGCTPASGRIFPVVSPQSPPPQNFEDPTVVWIRPLTPSQPYMTER